MFNGYKNDLRKQLDICVCVLNITPVDLSRAFVKISLQVCVQCTSEDLWQLNCSIWD